MLKIRRYRKFAGSKFRPLDEAFIASFNAGTAGKILQGCELTYRSLGVEQTMLPTPPPSEKSVDDDDLDAASRDVYGMGQILTI